MAQAVAGLSGMSTLSSAELCAPQMVAMPVPEGDVATLKSPLEGLAGEVPC